MKTFQEMFCEIRGVENAMPNIEFILEKAGDAVYRHGIRGLVIDPYNEVDHQRPSNQTETEYVSKLLSKVSQSAPSLPT
jgi:twinkle protein